MTTIDSSRKRKRLSKNKKKSWKRTDIVDVEEYLEDKRLQERTGGLVSEKTDAELFFVDKVTDDAEQPVHKKKRRERKPLKCDEIIAPDTKVPPVTVKRNVKHPDKKMCPAKREKLKSGAASQSQQMSALQSRQAKDAHNKKRAKKPNVATFDLWGVNDINVPAEGEDIHFLEQTRKKRVQPHARLQEKPSGLPVMELPHPGSSYNPTYDDHQDLLQKALDVEIQKERELQKVRRALDDRFPGRAPTEASYLEEMSAGIFEEDEDSEDSETEVNDPEVNNPDRLSVNPPVRREDKKTIAQRNKERRQKLQRETAQKGKHLRQHEQQKFRLKSIKAGVKERQEMLALRGQKKAKLRELHKNDPKKLGKLKYEIPDLEIKLSDEIQGSLRLLKPEGNLSTDRFRSLQRRNIIETRNRTKVVKKYKRKKFMRKSHQEVK